MLRKTFFVLLVLFASQLIFADVMWLSPGGVTQLNSIAKKSSNGKYYVRGQIIVHRDSNDKLTLKYPRQYFLFKPENGSERQMEWKWTDRHQITPEIDTMEDIRAIISNRDKKYGSLNAALRELLLEVDPDKQTSPCEYHRKIAEKEGCWHDQQR